MKNLMQRGGAVLICLAAALFTQPAAAAWVGSWGASPQAPIAAGGPFPASPSFNNQTIRQIVRLSAGGTRVRLRLTNAYGTKTLKIGAAHVALAGKNGAIQPGTDHVVTFEGAKSAEIPPGAPLLSDSIDLKTTPLSRLAVSLYLPGDTGPCSCHMVGQETAYVSGKGDFTGAKSFKGTTTTQRAFLARVDVDAGAGTQAIVAFGDSITDGVGSTANQDHRWPDYLADRLAKHGDWGVVNEGISGNRLLQNGAGDSALSRFDRDVLSVPGAKYVIVFEGINDIGFASLPKGFGGPDAPPPQPVTADDLIGAYKQLIARAHAHGLKIIGATITPYKGASYFSKNGEATREAVNKWIRNSGAFDGVIDFDRAWRSPKDATRIRDGFHAGDHLHGDDKGYNVAADAIDLSLFGIKSHH
jgi:lysophospholipase L1-like esterase